MGVRVLGGHGLGHAALELVEDVLDRVLELVVEAAEVRGPVELLRQVGAEVEAGPVGGRGLDQRRALAGGARLDGRGGTGARGLRGRARAGAPGAAATEGLAGAGGGAVLAASRRSTSAIRASRTG